MKSIILFAAAAAIAAPAAAQVTVDGSIDAAYGSASATVTTDAAAPTGNFDAPTSTATVGYDLYQTVDGGYVYGLVSPHGDAAPVGTFANLYYDLNPTVGDGSDLGFEIGLGTVTAFIPGKNGQVGFSTALDSSLFDTASGADGFEFSLATSLFTSPIAGLAYYDGQTFEPTIVTRLSQSLSYSVAGGDTYGEDRLGALVVGSTGAVPEPATWAMMLLGFGAIGVGMRKRGKGGQLAQMA
jgi:PEP-CTERM motif-containing protein